MKIVNKKMDYDKVMALPVKPRKKPKKVNMFFRTLMKTLSVGELKNTNFLLESTRTRAFLRQILGIVTALIA